jgi:hypothetical protein
MPWWLGVLVASALISVNNLLLRRLGFRPALVLWLVPLLVGAELGYSYAYSHAPKFLHAWFLGTASMAVLGLASSALLDRSMSVWDGVAVGCIVVGAYLLVR